jgi:N-acetylglucosamine kinase-like BadF-type ATPase
VTSSGLLLLDVGGSNWRAEFRYDGRTERARCEALPPIKGGTLSPLRLGTGLAEIWSRLGHVSLTPRVVAMATAGMTRLPGDKDAVHDQLHKWRTVQHTLLVSDAAASLAGALGDLRPGCLLSVGTGVAAVARSADGAWVFKDGWGPLLGDEGGGFWIGSAGLRAALRHRDSRLGGSSTLAEMAVEQFGQRTEGWPLRGDLEQVVQQIASFSTKVLAAAGTGDRQSLRIVEEACSRLLDAARAISSGDEVHIAGGLVSAPLLKDTLFDRATSEGLQLVEAQGDALSGLALLDRYGLEALVDFVGELGSCRTWC